jgi:pyrimidine deaminase RibD-like protein
MESMETLDLKFMKEAIEWAETCSPVKESIPKVGAIIAVGGKVIGRGRRGTGLAGDDEHAELRALKDVKSKSMLVDATLYTTLEPCTRHVRSKPLECCTELIRQHQFRKVFVGILDPNEGVTGKGVLLLQDSGVEVALFPPNLSKQIRIQNADFIRYYKGLGAEIVTPKDGDMLRTYESGGKHPVRFKCVNKPGDDLYLFTYRNGLYWPQPGPFRKIDEGTREVTAHFGTTGEHALQLVTANGLGDVLIQYYRRVVEINRQRREKLRDRLPDLSLLGGDYPGIEMPGLPKGLRLEATVTVFVTPKVIVHRTTAAPTSAPPGKTLRITYEIETSEAVSERIWLGASFHDKTGKLFCSPKEDKLVALTKGKSTYQRDFTIRKDAPAGEQSLNTEVWRGVAGDSTKSKIVARGPAIPIRISG